MKRTIRVMFFLLLLSYTMVFAGGTKENLQGEKIVRIAEEVPGLITPGVWDGQAFSLNGSIYEYLVEVNADTGELEPLLATDWSTDDGFTWKFTLRKGVTFHDGSDFEAKDVKYTIERTQDPSIGHLKKNDFEVVDSIETPDNHTIIVHLSEPRPTFVYQFTDYNMAILSRKYDYANLGESKPMGTGAFILQKMITKESATLVRNPNYWAKGLPIVDKLAIYFVPDVDASISMLKSNRVDIVPFVTQVIKKGLEKYTDIEVISPYQVMRFVSMRVDQEPFNDNRVRLAFKYAMDPQVIARNTAQMNINEGVYYNETPIMNILPEYKDIPMRVRDIEKAKTLLAEAGYPNGVAVEMYYASDHGIGKELAQTMQELALPAGFKLTLKGYTRDVYLAQYWLKVQISNTGWAGRIDPSMLLLSTFRGGGPWNESHMDNPKINDLIDKIALEADIAKRMGYYHELQQVFHDEGALINLQVPLLVAINTKIKNYRHPLTQIPQYKYIDIK